MAFQRAFGLDEVNLTEGILDRRHDLNRTYLLSFTVDNLLQNHRLQAGIGRTAILRGNSPAGRGDDRHWGWETPGSPMGGHFVGHWMSAAAREVAVTRDREVAARLREVVDGIAECQAENGGHWAFGISERSLDRLAAGRPVWAPQYVLHKTLMGLVDATRETNDTVALDVAVNAARFLDRWSAQFTREQFDDILDVETGGMLEVWADLLELTGDPMFARLLERYDRPRLFDPLRAGIDVLTNMHANTTIPEILGAARAYEVTGKQRWREAVEAYWRLAVAERGTFVTGGQTAGEVWTPPFEYAARRGDKNQEHCTVYNMIRLADTLFRWTGQPEYLDYIEQNTYNGLLAQQHPETGMVAYFLPLAGGLRKQWGTPNEDFWCCHGTLLQAHTRHAATLFYQSDDAITVAQYHPAVLRTCFNERDVKVEIGRPDRSQEGDPTANSSSPGPRHRPSAWHVTLKISAEEPVAATIRLRIPEWVEGTVELSVDGNRREAVSATGFIEIPGPWQDSLIELQLPKRPRLVPIPDEPSTVAFVDGPVVLAAEAAEEMTLASDGGSIAALLRPDNEREWGSWMPTWRLTGQARTVRLRPLYQITDAAYSVFFPRRPAALGSNSETTGQRN